MVGRDGDVMRTIGVHTRSVITEQQLRRAALCTLLATSLLAIGVLPLSLGCLISPVEQQDVTVLPRVVVDGAIELSDRTAGRVFVDEVVAHAPQGFLLSGDCAGFDGADLDGADFDGADAGCESDSRVDELVDANNPLLFRYDVTDASGFGAVVGGERQWRLNAAGGAVEVGFGPLGSPAPALHNLAADSGLDLDALAGHTLVVHGRIAVRVDGTGGLASVRDGDPDGAPADAPNEPDDLSSEGDPDGAPADNTEGDPDGAPADGDPDGAPADGDPDGAPAMGDAADGDPDGAPARPNPVARMKPSLVRGSSTVHVPFTLLLDSDFDTRVAIDAETLASLNDGEVLPLDLHVSLDALLSRERLSALEDVVRTALGEGGSVVDDVTLQLSSTESGGVVAVRFANTSVAKPKATVRRTGSRIHVSGDLRRP